MSRFLTLEEAAERLGVEYKTVYRLVRAGDIPAGKVGRIYRVREDDLDAYFERQKQQMAEQTGRTALTALKGHRCGSCDSPILSELSVGGNCEQCERDICQACWAIRKVRRCSVHTKSAGAVDSAHPDGCLSAEQAVEDPETINHEAVVNELRKKGQPAVSAVEAKLAEQAFVRAFAQRLENIEELPDPIGQVSISLRQARVKHVVESTTGEQGHMPANLVNRFVLRIGGWGKPKTALVLEGRFLSRAETLAANGYDAEPLGEAELTPLLNELRTRAKNENCFHVVSIGSPTGWNEAAAAIIANREHGRAFHDRLLGVALYDLHADEAHLDDEDERLWAFWPLLAPAKYAQSIAMCVERLEELAIRYEHVSLEYAVQQCGGDVSWVRTAFDKLKQTGRYEVRARPKSGLMLSRLLA